MQTDLKVSIIQANLQWEDSAANRISLAARIDTISEDSDLIVLPEMFTTGFTMNASALAEQHEGATLEWMQQIAKNRNAAITGSIIVTHNSNFYNRLYFVFPDGSYDYYDKKHTFTLAGEHKIYTAGTRKLLVNYKGWKICPLICYDLRFPVWARNIENYDLLVYVANWPKKRIRAWDVLLKARAIENMSYCVGVNRIGVDANGHEYVGHSAVYDLLGELVSSKDNENEFVSTVNLSRDFVETTRKQLQFLEDRDTFNLS